MDIATFLILTVCLLFSVVVTHMFFSERKYRKQKAIKEKKYSAYKLEERRRKVGCGDMGFIQGPQTDSTYEDDQDYENYNC